LASSLKLTLGHTDTSGTCVNVMFHTPMLDMLRDFYHVLNWW